MWSFSICVHVNQSEEECLYIEEVLTRHLKPQDGDVKADRFGEEGKTARRGFNLFKFPLNQLNLSVIQIYLLNLSMSGAM